MDKRILYILAGLIGVLVVVVGIEIGRQSSMTTGINLDLNSNVTGGRNAE